ncbi:hypothetical protein VY86_21635 [Photorhabdus thracensis]|uniref:Uncharacterized protein n=1 Tax=Photorhabdus thracensis TaxID=230089 RepID=A0A0F7LQN9_9GAMM|nr:hypothetical protein VY86_21635 [Photorhabdus thracensis]
MAWAAMIEMAAGDTIVGSTPTWGSTPEPPKFPACKSTLSIRRKHAYSRIPALLWGYSDIVIWDYDNEPFL